MQRQITPGAPVPGAPPASPSPCEGGGRWYVVQTQPNGESRALLHLQRQNYSAFCPRIRRVVRHARRSRVVEAPLFPNYLFVRMDIAVDRWRSINGTRGVVRVLTRDDVPGPVPAGVVEAIKERFDGDDATAWPVPPRPGQSVRIGDGAAYDMIGTLDRLDTSGRVRVLLDILGRVVAVTTRMENLSPAE